jgi:hypothetical protein
MRITLDDLENYGLASNLREHVLKLKPPHWSYAAALLAAMREDTESEMNRAWSCLPRSVKPPLDDKGARVVTELISRVISNCHDKMKKAYIKTNISICV